MKMYIALVLILALLLPVCGCGYAQAMPPATTEAATATAAPTEPAATTQPPASSAATVDEADALTPYIWNPDASDSYRSDIVLTYLALYLQQFDILAERPSFGYSLYDLGLDGDPELLIQTRDSWFIVYTIEDNTFIKCGEFGGGHSRLLVDGNTGIINYTSHMGVYEIVKLELDGTALIAKEIASGTLSGEESYPEVNEYGYHGYTQYIELSGASTGGILALG